jgi:hypothetical protein
MASARVIASRRVVSRRGNIAEIEARRQSLLAEHAASQRQLEAIGEAVQQVDVLTRYCARVRQRLQTFDETEKHRAIEALAIRVSRIPGEPLAIRGSIPLGAIAVITTKRGTCQLHCARRRPRQPHAGHDDPLEKRLRPTPRHGTLGTLALYGESRLISASVDMHCVVPPHHV